jgi:RNA polymerase sigma-70 factor (ECF subfamily)
LTLSSTITTPETGEVDAALELVDGLELESCHYVHAVRADLLRRLDRVAEARTAYERALELVHSGAERRLLERRVGELDSPAA